MIMTLTSSTFRVLPFCSTAALFLAVAALDAADAPAPATMPIPAASVSAASSTTSPAQLQSAADPAAARAEFEALEKKAAANDLDALNKLGIAYLRGDGVQADEAQAAVCFSKAAELGYAKSESNLGLMYAEGRGGLTKDWTEALKWLRKAAEQGTPGAQFTLAATLDLGSGVPRDVKEAALWYEKAANQGHGRAGFRLGNLYASGDGGFPKDLAAAAKWYGVAAEAGDLEAQDHLGVCYQYALGVEKDIQKAAEWFRRAAEQGYAKAQANLGHLYLFEGGLPRDKIAAYKWYYLSSEQDEPLGKNVFLEFKHELNAQEIAAAEQQIAEFKARRKSQSKAATEAAKTH